MIVVPIVLGLLIVILDGGMAFDRRETILHSLREGARSAAAGDAPTTVRNTAIGQSDGLLGPANVSVCYIDGPDSGGYPGDLNDAVRVTINYQYQTVFTAGPALNMNPKAEAVLLKPVAGASSC